MPSLFVRGRKLYAKLKAVDGSWKQVATGYSVGEEAAAQLWLADLECKIARQRAEGTDATNAPLTVRRFVKQWLGERRKLDLDWKHDGGRLEHHVLPVIGDMLVTEVRTRDIIDLVTHIRSTPSAQTGEPLAQRTVYNVYAVVMALFRDAKLADVIAQSPCCLTSRQLGPKRDKDPEWRQGAVFTRDEVETIISTPLIPADRRVAYALELLAGLRPGESAALRWRHYEAAKEPLGELFVGLSFSTKKNRAKGTKTDTIKHVPVHPTLAAILAEWRLSGWATMMGRAPLPDDLIVPMPPADAAQRTARSQDEAFRPYYYSGRRWREEDLPALGWRHRRHYDMRATFITLTQDDGADPHVIETRVTHTRKTRSAFDGYNRGRQWKITCDEVAKLRIVRRTYGQLLTLPVADGPATRSERLDTTDLGAVLVQPAETDEKSDSSWLRRRASNPRPGG